MAARNAPRSSAAEFEAYRHRIELADRLLLEAVAFRFKTVGQLMDWKRLHGLPCEDPAQEKVVTRRARSWASKIGFDPALAEELLKLLIAEGKRHSLPEPIPGASAEVEPESALPPSSRKRSVAVP
ncbi:MAG: chorismate mutase [Thermoplasmata archaeon]|nr:chorismate mutase [Thermoplasmata archaeon]